MEAASLTFNYNTYKRIDKPLGQAALPDYKHPTQHKKKERLPLGQAKWRRGGGQTVRQTQGGGRKKKNFYEHKDSLWSKKQVTTTMFVHSARLFGSSLTMILTRCRRSKLTSMMNSHWPRPSGLNCMWTSEQTDINTPDAVMPVI